MHAQQKVAIEETGQQDGYLFSKMMIRGRNANIFQNILNLGQTHSICL